MITNYINKHKKLKMMMDFVNNGEIDMGWYIGLQKERKGDINKALSMCKKSADMGSIVGMYHTARLYDNLNKTRNAYIYYVKAASNSHFESMKWLNNEYKINCHMYNYFLLILNTLSINNDFVNL